MPSWRPLCRNPTSRACGVKYRTGLMFLYNNPLPITPAAGTTHAHRPRRFRHDQRQHAGHHRGPGQRFRSHAHHPQRDRPGQRHGHDQPRQDGHLHAGARLHRLRRFHLHGRGRHRRHGAGHGVGRRAQSTAGRRRRQRRDRRGHVGADQCPRQRRRSGRPRAGRRYDHAARQRHRRDERRPDAPLHAQGGVHRDRHVRLLPERRPRRRGARQRRRDRAQPAAGRRRRQRGHRRQHAGADLGPRQ